MEGRCERHSFEPAENLCRACGYEFCHDCLVYTYGPKKPPYCLKCALTAAGIRSNAAVKPRANTREIKKDLKARRKEGPAAPQMESPVTIDWAVPDDDDPSAEPVEPALDDDGRGGRRAKRGKAKEHGRTRSKGRARGRAKKVDDGVPQGPQVTDLMPDAPPPATPPPAPTTPATPAIDPEPSRPALVDPLRPAGHDEPVPPPAAPPAEPAAPPAAAAAAAADPGRPSTPPAPEVEPAPDEPTPAAPAGARQVEGPRLIDQDAAPAPFPGPRSGVEPGGASTGPGLPQRTPGASRASTPEPAAAPQPPPPPAPPAAGAPPPPPAPARPETPPAPRAPQSPVEPLGPDPAKGFWRLMPSSIRAKVDRRHDHGARPAASTPPPSGFDLGPGAPQRVERELKTLAEMRPDELDQRLPDVTDLYDQVSDENTTTW